MKSKWKIAATLGCLIIIAGATIYYFRPSARKMRYYNIGIIYLQQGKYQQAINNLRDAVALDGNHVEFRYSLALAYVKDERWQQALDTIEAIDDAQQTSLDIYALFIQIYLNQKKYDQALMYSSRGVKKFADKARSYILHAKVLQEMNYPNIEKHLEKAITVDPTYVNSYVLLATYLANKKLFDRAISCLQKYIEHNGHHLEVSLLLCNYWIEQKQYAKAISLLEELRHKFTEHNESLVTPLAFSLLQTGEVEKAWEVIQTGKITQYSEKNSRLIYTRGICQIYKRMYGEGINDLLWFRRAFPEISSTYYYLSIAYFETDKSALAFRELNRAIQLSPQNTQYQKFLINKLAQFGKWLEIEQKIQIFGKQLLEDREIQKLYAQALLQQQNYDKLEKINDKAAHNFALEIAWAKFLQGRRDEAIAALKKQTHHSEAYYLLAKIYIEENNWFLALQHAQIFLQKKPQSKYGLWLIAQIREAQGLYEEAQKICDDLIAQYPTDVELKNYLTQLYLKTDAQKAQQYYTQNFQDLASATQAQIYIANEDFAAAIGVLKKIPNKNSQELIALGSAHLCLNQVAYATDVYFKAKLQSPQTQAIEYFILAKILSHQQYTATTILERHPYKNTSVVELLVLSYLLSGQPQKAQRHLQKLSPKKFPMLYSAFYVEKKEYSKAKNIAKYIDDNFYREDIQQCIGEAQKKQFSLAPILLLDKLIQKDLWRPALTKIQETFIVMGSHFVVKLKEAQILEYLGDSQQAMQIYTELASQSQTARWKKARIYYANQQFSAARNELQQLTKNASAQVWLHLGNTYLQQENYAESLHYYQKALQLSHESISLELNNNIAWAMLHSSPPQVEQALKHAKKLEAFANTNAAAADTLGWAYFKKGERSKSLEYLNRAKFLLPGNEQIEKHIQEVTKN